MKEWEVSNVLSLLDHTDRNLWETIRFNTYVLAQINSKKKLKTTDIIKLPWDNDIKEKKDTSISNEEIERLKNKAEQMIKNF